MSIPADLSQELTREDAVRLCDSRWWDGEPPRAVVLAQLHQPLLCMPFGDFHRLTEEVLGCPVWTHEFADKATLIQRIETGDREPRNPMESLAAVLGKI